MIEIMNNGIGPALIKSFQIYIDGVEVEGNKSEIVEIATIKLFADYQYDATSCFLSKGYMIGEKNKHEIFGIKFTGQKKLNYEEYKKKIARVRLLIEYESIYKNKFVYDSDKFSLIN